jgi:hypothetical protein
MEGLEVEVVRFMLGHPRARATIDQRDGDGKTGGHATGAVGGW